MSPIERDRRFNLMMSAEDAAMLDALADAKRTNASEAVRTLIREAYAEEFGEKMTPKQTQIRARLEELTKRDDVQGDVRAEAVRCLNARKAFDKARAAALAIAAEEEAYGVLDVVENKGLTHAGQVKLLAALRELTAFYRR